MLPKLSTSGSVVGQKDKPASESEVLSIFPTSINFKNVQTGVIHVKIKKIKNI
jgi:hypothetical protein